MPALIIKHRVADFDTWLRAFEGHAASRKAAGELDSIVCQSEGDPQSVVVFLEVESLERARQFMASADLAQTMQAAGVLEQPAVQFLESAMHYPG
jgi:hypothetical protein